MIDGQEGRLLPPGDVEALVAVLTAVAGDPPIVGRWKAGIRPVRTMAACADDYRRLYAEVLAEAEARSA